MTPPRPSPATADTPVDEPEPIRNLGDALKRLDSLLPQGDPDLCATLNPPVAEDSLERLRETVKPHDLHKDIETLLRWHDGQTGELWWPLVESGGLLNAEEARAHYIRMTEMCEPYQWSPSWVPIAHTGWYTLVVECSPALAGLVIDASFPDPPHPKAPSLMSMMRCVCDMLEANLPLKCPSEGSSEVAWNGPKAKIWREERNAVLRRAYPHYLQ